MRSWLFLLLVLFVAGMFSTGLYGDRILLKNGHEIIADVLKSDDRTLIVDFGFEVLRLPKSEIARVLEDGEDQASEGKPTAQSGEWQLYQTEDLKWSTIGASSERFGEAVVMVTSPGGQGSGFIISPEGFLITNYHVIARETLIKIVVFRKTESGFEQKHYKKVTIIALNPHTDLALLKIESEDRFKNVVLGEMDEIETGQQVFAIGNPLGLTRTVSQGIVSTTNRNFIGRLYIQTTTDINPGNSGGPLFNLKGQVVGVTSMGYIYLGGLNFAIPVNVVKDFIENRDAFAYDEDNPNAGYRYLQPSGRSNPNQPPKAILPLKGNNNASNE
jgi:serine protease Do